MARQCVWEDVLSAVEKNGQNPLLALAWLDANNLRSLLRDSEGLASVKKAKVSTAIPSMVFGEGQSKPCVVFCFVSPSLILTNISTSGLCAGNH